MQVSIFLYIKIAMWLQQKVDQIIAICSRIELRMENTNIKKTNVELIWYENKTAINCISYVIIQFLFPYRLLIMPVLASTNRVYIYRMQSKVVRRPFSLQPLVADLYFQLQNWFKKCIDLCYGIFKFQKSILWKLQKLTFYTVLRSL